MLHCEIENRGIICRAHITYKQFCWAFVYYKVSLKLLKFLCVKNVISRKKWIINKYRQNPHFSRNVLRCNIMQRIIDITLHHYYVYTMHVKYNRQHVDHKRRNRSNSNTSICPPWILPVDSQGSSKLLIQANPVGDDNCEAYSWFILTPCHSLLAVVGLTGCQCSTTRKRPLFWHCLRLHL